MDLLERYLTAVGVYLPAEERSDIIAELRGELTSQLEERQAELGHPLNTEETEALLKAYGHPVAVAAPYRRQQPLIGPLLLPWYWLVLRVTLGIAWITDLVIGCIGIASGENLMQVLGHLVQLLWRSTVLATGTITIVAVVLQRLGAEKWLTRWFGHITASWRPRDLPQPPPPPRRLGANWTVAWDLIGIGLLILWMTGAADAFWAPVSNFVHWRPADIVLALRWPVLLLVIAQTALHVMTAMRPQPTRPRTAFSLAVKVAALIVLLVLLRHWPWWQGVNLPPAVAVTATRGLNTGLGIGLGIAWGVVTVVIIASLSWDLGQLRHRHK